MAREVWTDQPTNDVGTNACTGLLQTGLGTESGSDRRVQTAVDGFQITGQVTGAVPFYVA